MKQIIDGKTFDTDAAERIMTLRSSAKPSSLSFYEHDLYRTEDGDFFIHGRGGMNSIWRMELHSYDDVTDAPLEIMSYSEYDAFDRIKGELGSAKIEEIFADTTIFAEAKKITGVFVHVIDQARIIAERTKGYRFIETIACDPDLDEDDLRSALRFLGKRSVVHFDDDTVVKIGHDDDELHDRCSGLSVRNSRNLVRLYLALSNGPKFRDKIFVQRVNGNTNDVVLPADELLKDDLKACHAPYSDNQGAIHIADDKCLDAFDWLVEQKYGFGVELSGWAIYFVLDNVEDGVALTLMYG